MLQLVVLASALVTAVVSDVRTRRIPNWLTGSLAVAGLGMALAGRGLTPGQAALGLVAGLLLMMPSHLIGATGAGDVKLMGAVGAVIGPEQVAGGVFAVIIASRRGRLGATLQGTRQLITAPVASRQVIEAPGRANRFAYGPAIAVGAFAALMVR